VIVEGRTYPDALIALMCPPLVVFSFAPGTHAAQRWRRRYSYLARPS